MFKFVLLGAIALLIICLKLQFANLASILSANKSEHLYVLINESVAVSQQEPPPSTTIAPEVTTTGRNNPTMGTLPNPLQITTTSATLTTDGAQTTTRPRPTPDADGGSTSAPQDDEANRTSSTTSDPSSLPPVVVLPPDANQPDKPPPGTKPAINPASGSAKSSPELSILFYSVFIVYVSFVKLIYHNIHLINHNLTEQGILMIFGILWQLVVRKLLTTDYGAFPRFNSKIFFYLFLPSTVLESASVLSNKWLFFNLLPILTHSIIGTVLHASSMGFTIFSLARSNVFALNWIGSSDSQQSNDGFVKLEVSFMLQAQEQQSPASNDLALSSFVDPTAGSSDRQYDDLTLAECLIFGTILSSIDSAPMLTVFKQYQVNEKLYYLVLGENLMNNAVVITIFNSLIDLFETTRLTVFRVYLATLQFCANLVGAVFIGFALALFALISVRLTKRFQLPSVLLSYQNQTQAMVETLLILKLAYLTYTLANLAGTSSIVGLATFGIINDQYIKHNLNLRSQLAFRQVILGMKTMGFSLVYPLLGMLLVDTALSQATAFNDSRLSQPALATVMRSPVGTSLVKQSRLGGDELPVDIERHFRNGTAIPEPKITFVGTLPLWADSLKRKQNANNFERMAATNDSTRKSSLVSDQANLNWYVKFMSIVIFLTTVYRFLIVISLGLIGNVLTCGQLKIKFKEQLLMAYGGFKGPLSIALVHSLIEHDNHRDRNTRNKHLFKYTVLMNIFISAVLAGTFIRPLVARIQTTLIGRVSHNLEDAVNSTIVFDQINYKLTEYVSHGLNSILGHSRSPYEKFIEFNETHIKPWLVRGGSNTNWLSVFYDNLILDETLNANCFHIATEDPTTMRAFRKVELGKRQISLSRKSREGGGRLSSMWRRRSSSVSFLDTINEGPQPKLAAVAGREPKKQPEARPKMSRVSTVSGNSSRASQLQQPKPKEKEVLKEFVMFNLKVENARRRRQLQKKRLASSQPSGPPHFESQYEASSVSSADAQAKPKFMIDNNSSNLSDSSLDRASRRVHLEELEFRLGRDEPQRRAAGPSRAPPDRPNVKRKPHEPETNRGGTFERQ